MDPQREIERILDEDGAKLIRDDNHRVYQLSNGARFVTAKTPSDWRAAQNSLHDLKRQLAVNRARVGAVESATEGSVLGDAQVRAASLDIEPSAGAVEQLTGFSLRLREQIAQQEQLREFHIGESYRAEAMFKVLSDLEKALDTPEKVAQAEVALKTLFPDPPRAVRVKEGGTKKPFSRVRPAPPPDRVTDHVQVTRQLVWAATQTFERPFNTTDLAELMIGDKKIDTPEKVRVRQAIASMIRDLANRGEVREVQKGIGRRPGIFRRIVTTGSGGVA